MTYEEIKEKEREIKKICEGEPRKILEKAFEFGEGEVPVTAIIEYGYSGEFKFFAERIEELEFFINNIARMNFFYGKNMRITLNYNGTDLIYYNREDCTGYVGYGFGIVRLSYYVEQNLDKWS